MDTSPKKARLYLYDKDGIIQKVTYINEDGTESDPLRRYFHLGMFQDTVLFGDNDQIRFFLYNGMMRGIALYDSDVNNFEIVNNSMYDVFYGNGDKRIIVMPGETKTVECSIGDVDEDTKDDISL